MITLKVYPADGQPPETRSFPCDLIKIGTRYGFGLHILRDDKVSRIHASLERLGRGSYLIWDCGSINGTAVNGKRVNSASLTTGDEIQVGNTRILIEEP